MDWYLMALQKYAVFTGRAQRKEYWLFYLFNVIFTLALAILDVLLGTFDRVSGIGVFSGLYSVAVLIPTLAVSVRRLHDTNRSGWWFLVVLVPLVGGIAFFVFMVLDGNPGPNQFGPDPKKAASSFAA
jgi:uncharacterized membrane protein YhaH (DUF805 family)